MNAARQSTADEPAPSSRRTQVVSGFLILVLTVLAYVPAIRAGYVWDDPEYVTKNECLTSLDGLGRIWTPRNTPQYYPLVFTSFWAEYRLWELHPLGYHLTNVLLHALSAMLIWRLLLTLNLPGAWCCAAVFALHPVHVESVAWITERKNVLSGVFYLLSLGCYLRFDDRGRGRSYWGALAFFLLALLSKTVTCTLPVVFLLLRWYRKGPLRWRDVLSVLPFLAMGAAMGTLTVWLERHHVGAEGEDWSLTFAQRFLIAGRAVWFYVGKLLWPAGLAFVYPRWSPDTSRLVEWIPLVGAVAVLLALGSARGRIGRGPFTAALFFLVTLSPALGFVDVFPFRYSFVADHFQYLGSLGIIVPVVGGALRLLTQSSVRERQRPEPRTRADAWRSLRVRSVPGYVIAGLILSASGVLTWNRCKSFRDEEALWRDTLAKNPGAWMAHFNLGLILQEKGDTQRAFTRFQETVRLRPQHYKAHAQLAHHYKLRNELDQAVEHYQSAVEANPGFLNANINLGNIFSSRGEPEQAVRHYRKALEVAPDDAQTRTYLGVALIQLGEWDPAVREFTTALDIQPDLTSARLSLAAVLSRQGAYASAVKTLRHGLEHSPQDVKLNSALSWILSTCPDDNVRNGAEAVLLAERVVQQVGYEDPNLLNTLAVAYAETGRFEEALQVAGSARNLALSRNKPRLAQQIDAEIAGFQEGKPYRARSSGLR